MSDRYQGTLAYNAACIHALDGRLDEARALLPAVFRLNPPLREFAPQDPDLAAIHAEIVAGTPAQFADRLRKFWKGKFLIKGIDTREDARLAIEHGLDGILVSNHGGRSTETARATIQALPEVVHTLTPQGRVPGADERRGW